MRIPFDDMQYTFQTILQTYGFTPERAATCARLFAEASRDGVYSHGLNRFPVFLDFIRKGYVIPDAEPVLRQQLGVMEQWDGQSGPGNLNATFAMDRAIAIAKEHGIGCVAIRNTNHWMRAGSYGWQAAEAGCIGLCWTNTMPNMPPWGAKESKLGNNPLVLAVPREEGHIVLDIAMSQYSYGKLGIYAESGQPLPSNGGFDRDGNLTTDAAAIIESRRSLPIGMWKGSGLSFLLDIIAAMLSGGNSTSRIGQLQAERQVSQVFLAFDAARLPDQHQLRNHLDQIIADLHSALPDESGGRARYPGESTLAIRAKQLRDGVEVDPAIWKRVREIADAIQP